MSNALLKWHLCVSPFLVPLSEGYIEIWIYTCNIYIYTLIYIYLYFYKYIYFFTSYHYYRRWVLSKTWPLFNEICPLCPAKLIFLKSLLNLSKCPARPSLPSHKAKQSCFPHPPTPSSSLGILPPNKFSVSNGSKSYITLKNSLNSKECVLTVPGQAEFI